MTDLAHLLRPDPRENWSEKMIRQLYFACIGKHTKKNSRHLVFSDRCFPRFFWPSGGLLQASFATPDAELAVHLLDDFSETTVVTNDPVELARESRRGFRSITIDRGGPFTRERLRELKQLAAHGLSDGGILGFTLEMNRQEPAGLREEIDAVDVEGVLKKNQDIKLLDEDHNAFRYIVFLDHIFYNTAPLPFTLFPLRVWTCVNETGALAYFQYQVVRGKRDARWQKLIRDSSCEEEFSFLPINISEETFRKVFREQWKTFYGSMHNEKGEIDLELNKLRCALVHSMHTTEVDTWL